MSRPFATNANETSSVPRSFSSFQCTRRCPRRYSMAFLLCLLYILSYWKNCNTTFTVVNVLMPMEHTDRLKYDSIGNWTVYEVENYLTATSVIAVFAQIPGALIIFIISSYKFLLISVTVSSVIHMLIPVALRHHSISLLLVLISQTVIGAPINIAILSMWKDWAPPMERTKLITFSLLGQFTSLGTALFVHYLIPLLISDESYYLSGTAGLVWALVWYCAFSDTPPNDPMISESEHVYLEVSIPSGDRERIKLGDVPWKSILTSKPVIVLCVIYFKLSCSFQAMIVGGLLHSMQLILSDYNTFTFFIPFFLGFLIVPLLSAILADYLIQRNKERTLSIRKRFLCIGFSLQVLLFFGTLSPSHIVETIFFLLSYLCFAASLSGFVTVALDLSPRYVTIIAGVIYTFYKVGFVCYSYIAQFAMHHFFLSFGWAYLFEGILSIACAILFYYFGDVEEQSWSYLSSRSCANGVRCYPMKEDNDNSNLMSEAV